MRYILFILIFLASSVWANQSFLPLPLLTRNDQTLNLTTKNLEAISTVDLLKAEVIGSVQWERSPENLLLPKVKVRLSNQKPDQAHFYFRYQKKTHLPQTSKNREFLDLDLSLFDSDRIEVLKEDKKVGEVFVQTFSDPSRGVNILMDYSCSGYNLQVFGFEGHFVTVGCELIRETQEGEVVPSLRVYWSSNEYKTLDGSRGPYQITFTEAREARLLVQTNAGKKKEVFFKVKFPERLHRLRTSIGLGPHIYQTSKEELKTQEEVVPSFMLYGNYYLNNIHSLKFFEALIAKETIFNHAGLYVGSELGKFYDDRLVISSLIGLQALSHRYDSNDDAIFTQIIFPQGIELTVHHPFGMENYRFSIGGFLSPQSDVTYQNFWARFGTRTFIEFNFINWGYGNREAIMYGLSVGFPFLQF